MNKYQIYFINRCEFLVSLSSEDKKQKCYEDQKIIITQSDDITKTKYNMIIAGVGIGKIYSKKASSKTELSRVELPIGASKKYSVMYQFLVDFEDKIDEIEIQFINGLADNLTIPVVFVDADKEAYYAKIEKNRVDTLLSNLKVKHSTGADLVNIYFQPCSDAYDNSKLFLYHDNQLIAQYKVDEGVFFKSISGLAYGKYSYELAQYDDKGNEIIRTNRISFTLDAPNYGGKNWVVG